MMKAVQQLPHLDHCHWMPIVLKPFLHKHCLHIGTPSSCVNDDMQASCADIDTNTSCCVKVDRLHLV